MAGITRRGGGVVEFTKSESDMVVLVPPSVLTQSGLETGTIQMDPNRLIPVWWDGDGYEYPTFVEDVDTTDTVVTNTTDETEVFRADLNADAMVQNRVFVIRSFGKYSTGSSQDNFQYRAYTGDSGFGPTADEGTEVATASTVQENVTDGPFQSKTTITVDSEGQSGNLDVHTEARFNNTANDDHVAGVTTDTTSANEFVLTVQWNNAKSDNHMTVGQAYLQQNA